MDNSTKDRLLMFINHLGIPAARFEKKINVSNGYLRNIQRPSDKVLECVLSLYPELSRAWLFSGEGEMFSSPMAKPNIKTDKITQEYIDMLKTHIVALNAQIEKKDEQISSLLETLKNINKK